MASVEQNWHTFGDSDIATNVEINQQHDLRQLTLATAVSLEKKKEKENLFKVIVN